MRLTRFCRRRRFQFEKLECRKLLAAAVDLTSIQGRVFDDFTGDGYTAGEEVAGATVELYRDANGDRAFQSGVDTRVTTQVTQANGNYKFDRLTQGVYFVVQPQQTAGTKNLPLAVSPLIDITATDVTGRIVTLIDDFSESAQTVRDITNDGAPVTQSQVAASGVIGGERDLSVNKTSDNGAVELSIDNPLLPNQLTFDSVSTGAGNSSITWDGPDNSPTINDTGLTGVNFTGDPLGIQLQIRSDLAGGTVTVRLFSDDGNSGTPGRFSSVTVPIPVTTQNFLSPEFIPFSSFVAAPAGGVNLSNIGAIQMQFNTPADVNGAATLLGAVATNNFTRDFANFDSADLRLSKTVNNPAASVGSNVTFTLGVTNDGPSPATGIRVRDLLPAGLTFVPNNPPSTVYDSATGIWQVGNLGLGQTANLAIIARVDSIGAKTNTAEITASDQTDPDSTVNDGVATQDDFATATVTPSAIDLSLTKTADNLSPNPGSPIRFTITVSNAGPANATNVVVRDLLPAGFTLNGSTPAAGTTYNPVNGNWSIPTLASGASTTLDLNATVTTRGSLSNTAEIIAADQFDTDSTPNNNVATEDDQRTVTLTTPTADLSLSKTTSTPSLNIGQEAVYTVVVTNAGPDTATNIVVGDSLPAGLTLIDAQVNPGTLNANSTQWTIPSLAVGQTATWNVRARLDSRGTKTNTAQILSVDQRDPDSTPGNGVATEDDFAMAVVQPTEIDLSVTKTIDRNRVAGGDTIIYTVQVANAGPDTATGVVVRDVLPTSLSFVSSNTLFGGYDSTTGRWSIPSIATGATVTLTLTAIVLQPIPATNTAEIVAADQFDRDSTPANNVATEDDQASVAFTVIQSDLSITKTVNKATPNVGEPIAFTINLRNDGPDAAGSIVVRDALPSGLRFENSSATVGNYDSTTGRWTLPGLANLASASLTINATPIAADSIINTAEVIEAGQSDRDSTPGNNIATEDDQASVTVTARQIDLSLEKSVNDASPTVGEEITFVVRVANAGPSPATGIVVADPLPAGLTLVRSVASRGSYNTTTGRWTLDTLAPAGNETLQLITRVNSVIGAGLNTAEIVAADQADVDSTPGNNVSTEDDQASVTFRTPVADLSLDKTVDNVNPNIGDRVIFDITVTNSGPDDATGVVVEDLLPAGFKFFSTSVSAGTYDPVTGRWSIGALGNGQTATLSINTDLTSGTQRTNTARVFASEQVDPDSRPGNNVATEDDQKSIQVTPQSIDLALTKTVSDPRVRVGEEFEFLLTLTNSGEFPGTGIVVRDILPDGLDFISAAASVGDYDNGTGQWTIPTIARTDSETLRLRVVNSRFGTYSNTAEVIQADQFDIDSTPDNAVAREDDQASVSVASQSADLSITKTVDNELPNRGEEVTFEITVFNNGPDDAASIVVEDTLPAGLRFVRSTATRGDYTTSTGLWRIPSIDSGESATLEIIARVETFDDQTNFAEIIQTNQFDPDSEPDNNDPNEDDLASAFLSPQLVDLALTKTVDQATADVGETVRFTITLKNDGPDDATDIVIREGLPSSLELDRFQTTSGIFDLDTRLWTVSRVVAGQTQELIIDAIVRSTDTINNVAEIISAKQTDIDSTPNNQNVREDDQASTRVRILQADLTVQKRVSNPRPELGEEIQFITTLRHNGPDTATNVVVKDPLPAGFAFVRSEQTLGNFNSSTGLWTIDNLITGQVATLQVVGKVNSVAIATSQAEIIASDRFDPDSVVNNNVATEDDQASITLEPRSVDIELELAVDNDAPKKEEEIQLTAIVRNAGNINATGVTASVPLPTGMTLISATTTGGTYNADTGVFNVGNLAVNQSQTLTLNALVTEQIKRSFTGQVLTTNQPDRDSTPGNNIPTEDDQDTLTIQAPRTLNKRMFLAR